jgi:hypothetical protein
MFIPTCWWAQSPNGPMRSRQRPRRCWKISSCAGAKEPSAVGLNRNTLSIQVLAVEQHRGTPPGTHRGSRGDNRREEADRRVGCGSADDGERRGLGPRSCHAWRLPRHRDNPAAPLRYKFPAAVEHRQQAADGNTRPEQEEQEQERARQTFACRITSVNRPQIVLQLLLSR